MSEQRLIETINGLIDDPQSSTTSLLSRAKQLADLAEDATHSRLFSFHLSGGSLQETTQLLSDDPKAYRMFFSDRKQTGKTTSLIGSLDSLEGILYNCNRDLEDALQNAEKIKDAQRGKLYSSSNNIELTIAFTLIGSLRTNRREYSEIIARIRARVANFVRERENALLKDTTLTSVTDEAFADAGLSLNRVFVVHGHDSKAKEEVARFLSRLGLEPVILHEQPNKGRTIIEKFEDHSDVGFAVVLLTPDDLGGLNESTPQLVPRARQNVVLELGFFFAKLRRARVCALYTRNIELPSDISGIAYIPFDGEGWQLALARELKAAGLDVDMNNLA
jgi:predicted nucleotide-binding protein